MCWFWCLLGDVCVPPLVIQEKESTLRGVFQKKVYSPKNLCEFSHATPGPLCIQKAVEISTAPGSVGLLILTICKPPFSKNGIHHASFLIIRRKHPPFCIVFFEKFFLLELETATRAPHYTQKKRVFCIVSAEKNFQRSHR